MAGPRDFMLGKTIPDARLAELCDDVVTPLSARDVLGRGHAIAIGIPGAFTPVCSSQHAPAFVANAERLRKSGYTALVCVVASDPFVTEAWARIVDPARRVRFVSDGNLEFARAMGLNSQEREFFLGERSQRYLITLRGGMIETIRVEASVSAYACTRPDDFVLNDAA